MEEFVYAFLTELYSDFGYLGIVISLMVEAIPSEIVLSFGGYLVSQGKINFVGAVIAGTIGGTVAQLFIYWMGYYGGRPFLEKYGKYFLIHKKHIEMSEMWFNKYGPGVIFTARFIPVVRHAISIPAGIAKMSFIKFTAYTTFAVLPWSIFFIYLGRQLGSNWQKINEIAKLYFQPVVIIAVLFTIAFILLPFFKKRLKN